MSITPYLRHNSGGRGAYTESMETKNKTKKRKQTKKAKKSAKQKAFEKAGKAALDKAFGEGAGDRLVDSGRIIFDV